MQSPYPTAWLISAGALPEHGPDDMGIQHGLDDTS
jgi:hypothetical protein